MLFHFNCCTGIWCRGLYFASSAIT